MKFLEKYQGSVIVTMIVVCMCIAIGVISVIEFHGDNPVENAADAVINKELGTQIDISDIMKKIDDKK